MNEEELVKRARDGDSAAFETLMHDYFKRIYNIAFRIAGNADDAADMTQETMIKLLRNIKSFKGESKFSTWVYRVATNTCLDELKKLRKNNARSLSDSFDTGEGEIPYDVEDTAPTPEQSAEKHELRDMVAKAVLRLSGDHRAAIVLRDIRGFSYTEIAEILGCSEGTVKSRISRARAQLKQVLEKDFGFNGTYFG